MHPIKHKIFSSDGRSDLQSSLDRKTVNVSMATKFAPHYPQAAGRTYDQVVEHYEIEKALAQQLRSSTEIERGELYSRVYAKLFSSVPHHPQLRRKLDASETAAHVARQLKLIKRFTNADTRFMEIGSGDCALSFALSKEVKRVVGVDVVDITGESARYPKNFALIISDGTSIPVAENSIDIAYSNQLMEHLHPDDAKLQLRNIFRALTYNGIYICSTPNRINGPHDISIFFDDVATGFHLHEYTMSELGQLFLDVGFNRVKPLLTAKGKYFSLPFAVIQYLEARFSKLPKDVCRWYGIRQLICKHLIAYKQPLVEPAIRTIRKTAS